VPSAVEFSRAEGRGVAGTPVLDASMRSGPRTTALSSLDRPSLPLTCTRPRRDTPGSMRTPTRGRAPPR
jgi:hypothetical protein